MINQLQRLLELASIDANYHGQEWKDSRQEYESLKQTIENRLVRLSLLAEYLQCSIDDLMDRVQDLIKTESKVMCLSDDAAMQSMRREQAEATLQKIRELSLDTPMMITFEEFHRMCDLILNKNGTS